MENRTCKACPFAFTDESDQVQNLGCLPSPFELMVLKRETGRNWACHENDVKPCRGMVEYCREEGVVYTTDKPLITYTKWCREGVGDLLSEATNRILK